MSTTKDRLKQYRERRALEAEQAAQAEADSAAEQAIVEKARNKAIDNSKKRTTTRLTTQALILAELEEQDKRYPNSKRVKLTRTSKPLWWSYEQFDAYEGAWNKNNEMTKMDDLGNTAIYYCYRTPTPNTAIFVPKKGGTVYWSTTGDDTGELGEPLGEFKGTGAMYDRDLWDLYDAYAATFGTIPVVGKTIKSSRFGGMLNYTPHYFDFFNNNNI